MPDTVIPTPSPAEPTARHRATWWDRAAIILLGLASCALSFDALRQMATAVHVRPHLTYLFPIVIDGFIAYGVRALLVLREAPMAARLYAWTLFIAATAASIWANGLHALDLNQPGTTTLRLGDTTVAILSAIAPLALAGATHLHILITRYGGTAPARTPVDGITAPVLYRPQTYAPPAAEQALPAPSAEAGATASRTLAGVDRDSAAGGVVASGTPQYEPTGVDEDRDEDSAPRAHKQGGRPPMAPLERLAEVIAAAHPDPDAITRDSARKSLTEADLGAGTDRLAEAIALVRSNAQARQHPDRPEEPETRRRPVLNPSGQPKPTRTE
ncbi:DUF2637 domain-containing protein [Streptomyces sp. NPDC093221]|uniref:DUF2637 domain-containing protein n=1 Tax=Streptomyces sp. NPDC093221 TaxID=3366032 RepID=UPI003826CD17